MSKEAKRIVFTNETPNSQGFITRNNSIDFARYAINPILLANHDWHALPIGLMTDMRLEKNGDYTGIPVFHKLTAESKTYSELYDGGWLSTASIGSTNLFRKDLGTNNFLRDPESNEIIGEYNKDGLLETKKVTLMEISLPSIPANHTAATKEALGKALENMPIKLMAYSEETIPVMEGELVTLESKLKELNLNTMAKKDKDSTELAAENTEQVENIEQTEKLETEKSDDVVKETEKVEDKDNSNHVILEAQPKDVKKLAANPGIIEKLIEMYHGVFGGKISGTEKLEEEELLMEKTEKAEYECVNEADTLKAEKLKSEKDEEKEEGDSNYKKEEEKDEEKIEKDTEKESKSSLSVEPVIKTKLEMEQEKDTTLAADPKKPVVLSFGEGVTFSKLMQDKKDGDRIMNRVFSGKNDGKEINDYKIILNSILADKKYAIIAEKTRFHMNGDHSSMLAFRGDLAGMNRQNLSIGLSYKEIAARLEQGVVSGINYSNAAREERRTTLTTTGSFASLDTVAVEWLPMTIFQLFPAEDWRNDIPLFGVQETGRNLGIIWTNIAAAPAIYRGTSPAPASMYTYSDTAVGLKLIPYWLQPMRWVPMDMHQLRYNQQDTGWAQAMNLLYSKINDDLLYTLAAGALANSQPIVYTGGPIDSTQAQTFAVGTGVNKFYFNPALTGNLTRPGFNDIISIEQLFNGLNFDLAKEKAVAIIDNITNSYIKQDKQTQSMLTRWINDQGADLEKISHTTIHERSRVVAYDPFGGTIVDMNASGLVLPATTQSCNLSLVSSQVGIGLGLIDVFAVQSPANYGFDMSMDLRIGIRSLRSDYKGVAMYAYGPNAQAGQ